MDIEAIKRNIRINKNGGSSYINTPPVSEIIKDEKEDDESTYKSRSANKVFFEQPLEEEEKPPPRSKYWDPEVLDIEDINLISGSTTKVIKKLDLENDVYQWDPKKPKGRKSRKLFTDFLVSEL